MKAKIIPILKKIIKWFLITSVVSVIVFRFIPVPITPFMVYSAIGQGFDDNRKVKIEKNWECIDDISSYFQRAAIASEDQKFQTHFGFDIKAIKKARELNKMKGKVYGASTITQQTAKNVFLLPYRNYIRKGFEAYFTLLMELFWSKKRIMEVYLNVIEFGDGIYGVEAASQHFFNKSARDINRHEAALMIAVLPNPKKYKVNNPSSYVRKRQRRILRQMKKIEPIKWENDQ